MGESGAISLTRSKRHGFLQAIGIAVTLVLSGSRSRGCCDGSSLLRLSRGPRFGVFFE